LATLASNVQSEQNQTTYSYSQVLKTPPLENVIKQNNTPIQNDVQEQQTNDILELTIMVKVLLERMDTI
jgi:hypothetical protein